MRKNLTRIQACLSVMEKVNPSDYDSRGWVENVGYFINSEANKWKKEFYIDQREEVHYQESSGSEAVKKFFGIEYDDYKLIFSSYSTYDSCIKGLKNLLPKEKASQTKKGYSINLTEKEIQTIELVLRLIGGPPTKSYRKYADTSLEKVLKIMQKNNVSKLNSKEQLSEENIDKNTIYFKETSDASV